MDIRERVKDYRHSEVVKKFIEEKSGVIKIILTDILSAGFYDGYNQALKDNYENMKPKLSTKEIAEKITKLLQENDASIRGYEGESSCVIIENNIPHDSGAEIDNKTQEVN